MRAERSRDDLTEYERAAVAAVCPNTDCEHENTYTCSGWAYAMDALEGLTAAGFRVETTRWTPPVNECCEIRDELWRSATGYDFLGDINKRLTAYTSNLNALARRQRGEASGRDGLPDEAPVYLNLLGLEWRAMVPSTWDGEPISVYQQMANLCSATAICAARAVANGRWAVNEHVRAERLTALVVRMRDAIDGALPHVADYEFADRLRAVLDETADA